jgi:2-hydroxy-6-oxo-octa-2,4-dienoate hydrolase
VTISTVSSSVEDAFDPAKLKFVEAGGFSTRYYEDGAGEPFVSFHGGQYGSLYSLDAWSLTVPALAKYFHVFSVDKLGQGYTDNPPTAADYTFDTLLGHTCALLEALDLGPAHLAGHSRGGLLVAAVAQTRPDLVKSILICDSQTLAPDDPRFPGQAFYDEVARHTPPGPPSLETVRSEPDAQAYDPSMVTAGFVQRMLDIALLPKVKEAQSLMKGSAKPIWERSMAEAKARSLGAIAESGLPCPTLIWWGRNDKSAPVPLGYALLDVIAEKTPKTSLHVANRGGHYAFREQPTEFANVARGFCLE